MLKPCDVCEKLIAMAPTDNRDLCRECDMLKIAWYRRISDQIAVDLDSYSHFGYTIVRTTTLKNIVKGRSV